MSDRRNVRRRRNKRKLKPWVKIALPVVLLVIILLLIFSRSKTKKKIVIEAGAQVPAVTEFLKKDYKKYDFVTDVSQIDTTVVGKYKVKVKVGWRTYKTTLKVIDTTAPTGTPTNRAALPGTKLSPEEFVSDVFDYSDVTFKFKKKPKFKKEGQQDVTVIMIDKYKNKTEITAVLTIGDDITAPVIEGAEDITSNVGETITYREGITVSDDKDPNPTLDINSTAVDINTPGEYEVIYKATDAAGNSDSVTIKVTIAEVSEKQQYVNDKVAEILDDIIKDDMDDLEKLYAIFVYVRENIEYVGFSDKTDVTTGAYDALSLRYGDCYNYYALAKVMLEAEGFEEMDVMRKDGHHYWNLVKYNGEWYHYDSNHHNPVYDAFETFMMTDEEADAYGQWVGRPDYYDFDPSTVPETPKESLKWNDYVLPAME